MDSWPVPPPETAARPQSFYEELAAPYALPPDRRERLALFLMAAARWVEAVESLAALETPSLDKQGRGVSSLTLRARELRGKFLQLTGDAPPSPVSEPVGRQMQAPGWLGEGAGLRDAVALTAAVSAETLEMASRRQSLDCLLAGFSRALPSLDLALRELPRLQERLTRLIWREEYLR